MSQRLGCELEDKISAIAVVAATMGRELFARCKPARPVSVLIIHGTEDPLVPYEGGRVQVRAGIVSAPDAADFSRRYPWDNRTAREGGLRPATARRSPSTSIRCNQRLRFEAPFQPQEWLLEQTPG